MIYNSIVLVSFPFDDFSFLKVRPALCVTFKIGNLDHIIIPFISGKIHGDKIPNDVVIEKHSTY